MRARQVFVVVLAHAVFLFPAMAGVINLTSVAASEIGDVNFDGLGDHLTFLPGLSVALGPTEEERTAFEFDLSGWPLSAADVHRAFVNFYRGAQAGSCNGNVPCLEPTSIQVYGYSGNGVMGVGDYSAGSLLGAFAPPPRVNSYFRLDVTDFVKNLIGNGDPFAGFTVRPGSNGGIFLYDPHGGDIAVALLRIEPVPEPASVLLLGSGLAAAMLVRRRKA